MNVDKQTTKIEDGSSSQSPLKRSLIAESAHPHHFRNLTNCFKLKLKNTKNAEKKEHVPWSSIHSECASS